ncbi:EAL domain-containing protein [Sulfurimonas sp. C5]|uniref:EAL domain-containing protein n=1 Tax=Sulfurimonas sp. C5 TaxID=3036947 RepID=UPI0024567E15|nr:EAL domain-containing protein [Sulfurimonas sp. C5]MDH4944934.1 EAL domain-containing protein [Sulfurimonas sp. C5]
MKLNLSVPLSIIVDETYGACYEPIVELQTMKVYGYEALSRFRHEDKYIPPNEFFNAIHDNSETFFHFESILKRFQLDNRPKGHRLFLNLDPHVVLENDHVEYWMRLFTTHKNIEIEIIENSHNENLYLIEEFMDWMDEHDITYAYDDFLKPDTLFFTSLFHRANTIKLDMDVIQKIRTNPAYIEVAKGIVKFLKASKRLCLLEGIEDASDLEIAKELGVDFVQGYYFKAHFIEKWNLDYSKVS